jgi:hypothetical protein
MDDFLIVFPENGTATKPMGWVDACVSAAKFRRRGLASRIVPRTRWAADEFDVGPACVQVMLGVVLKQLNWVRFPLPEVSMN